VLAYSGGTKSSLVGSLRAYFAICGSFYRDWVEVASNIFAAHRKCLAVAASSNLPKSFEDRVFQHCRLDFLLLINKRIQRKNTEAGNEN
jgi:hypothetical protein